MKLQPVHELILKFIEQTNQAIFMTGKAGTGKTTFLRYIKNHVAKNLAIVAPTAVAAINAGGVTINSFFQVPFGPLPPITENTSFFDTFANKVGFEKSKLIKCLDLLIIDEISMVRADTIDYIDALLRAIKGINSPFGGVQLLMIGDLYQLPPVFQKDWHVLRRFYKGPYFFDSLVFGQSPVLTFELTEVYRQSDPVFIEILNSIRNGAENKLLLNRLNEHYRANVDPNQLDDYVTLTTHNPLVHEINAQRLQELHGQPHHYQASISGDFPKEAFPVEEELVLKVGALVMFVKNDSSGNKLYYNGRTGRITELGPNYIKLVFLDDGTAFEVNTEVWENVKYSLSESEQKVNENSAGSFRQYPLRLAWAITIHKSQGLTFDKAIIDVSSAFAHGQTYVALSRCRTLGGLILKEKVKQENIITDPLIAAFMQKAQAKHPDFQRLEKAVDSFERQVLGNVFDFTLLLQAWQHLHAFLVDNGKLQPTQQTLLLNITLIVAQQLNKIALQFKRQELDATTTPSLFSNAIFKARLQKAAGYFLPKLDSLHEQFVQLHNLNKATDDDYYFLLNLILGQLKTKTKLFTALPTAVQATALISTAQSAAMEYQEMSRWNTKFAVQEKEIENKALYHALIQWRKETSKQRALADHQLVSEATLIDIAAKLPRSLKQLSMIKNFGEGKTSTFGQDILRLVRAHLGENELFF